MLFKNTIFRLGQLVQFSCLYLSAWLSSWRLWKESLVFCSFFFSFFFTFSQGEAEFDVSAFKSFRNMS